MTQEQTTTIRYGVSNTVTRSFSADYTVGQLIRDRSILGAVSAPEGVSPVSNGRVLGTNEYVNDFDTITLERQASSKA